MLRQYYKENDTKMFLLGYQIGSNQNNIVYDPNGFIKTDDLIFFGEDWTTTGIASLRCSLLEKTNELYKFDVCVQEEISTGHFVANGDVTIFYDGNKINKIIVNGVENGPLRDKYGDCFDIYPKDYIHLMCTKSFSDVEVRCVEV